MMMMMMMMMMIIIVIIIMIIIVGRVVIDCQLSGKSQIIIVATQLYKSAQRGLGSEEAKRDCYHHCNQQNFSTH